MLSLASVHIAVQSTSNTSLLNAVAYYSLRPQMFIVLQFIFVLKNNKHLGRREYQVTGKRKKSGKKIL
jgi:hypothetical protein